MNIFEKFVLARQVKFKDGKIILLKQRVVVLPAAFFQNYTLSISKDPKAIAILYTAFKKGLSTSMNVKKDYGLALKEYANLCIETSTMAGWGILRWERFDEKNKSGVVRIVEAPIPDRLKGKADAQCDHVVRGMIAGVASGAFKTDVDVIETECMAMGSPACRFVIDDKDNLKKKYPTLYKAQLPI